MTAELENGRFTIATDQPHVKVAWRDQPAKGGVEMSRTVALMLALAVVTAGVLAAGSSGARQTQRTIGLITRYGADGFFVPVESGARSAAAALGDHLTVTEAGSWGDGWAQISAIKSLIARHAAAIAFATDEPAALKQVLPALAQARAAGIPTVSFQLPSPGSVWVNQSSPAQFAQALADALASQMQQTGQFVIVSCRPAESIVGTELKLTEAYIQRRYPQMQRVASRLRGPRERHRGHGPVQPLDAGTPATARPDLPVPGRGLQPAAAPRPGRTTSARSSPPATAAPAHPSTTPTSPPFDLGQRRSSAPATRPSSAI